MQLWHGHNCRKYEKISLRGAYQPMPELCKKEFPQNNLTGRTQIVIPDVIPFMTAVSGAFVQLQIVISWSSGQYIAQSHDTI